MVPSDPVPNLNPKAKPGPTLTLTLTKAAINPDHNSDSRYSDCKGQLLLFTKGSRIWDGLSIGTKIIDVGGRFVSVVRKVGRPHKTYHNNL